MMIVGRVALIVAVLLVGTYAINFEVPAGKELCFYEDLFKGTDVGLTYQVSQGGQLDIDVTVSAPDGSVIYAGRKEKEGKYFFVTHIKGTFTFCFSNAMSTITKKRVNLGLTIGKQRSEEEIVLSILSGREKDKKDKDGKDDTIEILSPLQSSVMQLADGFHAILAEESYMRTRERVHRDTTESTNSRVLFFTILENILLVGVSVWQIYYLKRFFEVKRAV